MNRAEEARAGGVAAADAPLNYFNYFTEIEDAFVRRRGKHLLLSPVDWALIESWKEMGVPLHVALRGIEKSFDSFEARPRKRSVKTLMYCQEEVEAQFAEWRESQLGAAAPASGDGDSAGGPTVAAPAAAEDSRGLPFPREVIAAHLSDCRAALGEAAGALAGAAGAGELAEALGRAAARAAEIERDFNAAVRPDAELLEAALTDLEALLDRALRGSVPAGEVEALRREAESQLGPYKNRMGRETYEQTLDNLLAKRLREEHGVPRLSLFYL
ncbi:MAG TPA: hypothetical protein VEY09_16765 [Pyrinomonadaceae bacterium]|nr:hypothetical protein [Pyrinomonadaceae bacterium]